MTARQLCTFYLDDLFLGVDVAHVQEVVQTDHVTRVPLADSTVAGIINLRGQIVAAVNLRECLQRAASTSTRLPLSLVVCLKGATVSLFVDRMGDVLDLDESGFLPTPEIVDRKVARLLNGAYKLPQDLLLVLDTQRVLTHVKNLHSGARGPAKSQ